MQTRNVTAIYSDQTPPSLDVWHEVASSINSGAYAVLLAIAVVYVLTRRAIGKMLEHHFTTLEMLRETAQKNSRSIKTMALTQKRLTDFYIDREGKPSDLAMLNILNTPEDGEDDE